MSGRIKLIDYIKAAFPIVWVNTHERKRFISQLKSEMKEQIKGASYTIYSWDFARGVVNESKKEHVSSVKPRDPRAPISFMEAQHHSIMVLHNLHKFISGANGSIEVIQQLFNISSSLKKRNNRIIILSPTGQIPIELDKYVVLHNFELPEVEALQKIAQRLISDTIQNEMEKLSQAEESTEESKMRKKHLGSLKEVTEEVCHEAAVRARGLTQEEAENAFALSLIKAKTLDPQLIEELKLQQVRKSGLCEIWEPVDEKEMGGMDVLKKYIHNRKDAFFNPDMPQLKGILLLGLPGCGKSLASKVIAKVFNLPLARLNISALKSGIVGSSEERMRQALALIDAISPCVVWLDEVEKAIGGVASSNRSDSGTTAGMFGQLLTWMAETESRCYLVATCNDIEELMAISQGAFISRFDDVFFVDLPTRKEREEIIKIMNKRYSTKTPTNKSMEMVGWSGREIEKFTKASIFDGEEDALKNIHPISETNESLNKVREWAKANARIANNEDGGEPVEAEGRELTIN